MKKAQIEIMGFVMIVILVTIGMFFMVSLRQPSNGNDPVVVYGDEKLASNFLITLLETNVATQGDEEIKLHDIAIDCIRDKDEDLTKKYSFKSCDVLETAITTIFEQTLDLWGYGYEYTFVYAPTKEEKNKVLEISKGDCTGEISAPGVQPISLYRIARGTAVMELRLCS